jgi:hypothetical protein
MLRSVLHMTPTALHALLTRVLNGPRRTSLTNKISIFKQIVRLFRELPLPQHTDLLVSEMRGLEPPFHRDPHRDINIILVHSAVNLLLREDVKDDIESYERLWLVLRTAASRTSAEKVAATLAVAPECSSFNIDVGKADSSVQKLQTVINGMPEAKLHTREAERYVREILVPLSQRTDLPDVAHIALCNFAKFAASNSAAELIADEYERVVMRIVVNGLSSSEDDRTRELVLWNVAAECLIKVCYKYSSIGAAPLARVMTVLTDKALSLSVSDRTWKAELLKRISMFASHLSVPLAETAISIHSYLDLLALLTKFGHLFGQLHSKLMCDLVDVICNSLEQDLGAHLVTVIDAIASLGVHQPTVSDASISSLRTAICFPMVNAQSVVASDKAKKTWPVFLQALRHILLKASDVTSSFGWVYQKILFSVCGGFHINNQGPHVTFVEPALIEGFVKAALTRSEQSVDIRNQLHNFISTIANYSEECTTSICEVCVSEVLANDPKLSPKPSAETAIYLLCKVFRDRPTAIPSEAFAAVSKMVALHNRPNWKYGIQLASRSLLLAAMENRLDSYTPLTPSHEPSSIVILNPDVLLDRAGIEQLNQAHELNLSILTALAETFIVRNELPFVASNMHVFKAFIDRIIDECNSGSVTSYLNSLSKICSTCIQMSPDNKYVVALELTNTTLAALLRKWNLLTHSLQDRHWHNQASSFITSLFTVVVNVLLASNSNLKVQHINDIIRTILRYQFAANSAELLNDYATVAAIIKSLPEKNLLMSANEAAVSFCLSSAVAAASEPSSRVLPADVFLGGLTSLVLNKCSSFALVRASFRHIADLSTEVKHALLVGIPQLEPENSPLRVQVAAAKALIETLCSGPCSRSDGTCKYCDQLTGDMLLQELETASSHSITFNIWCRLMTRVRGLFLGSTRERKQGCLQAVVRIAQHMIEIAKMTDAATDSQSRGLANAHHSPLEKNFQICLRFNYADTTLARTVLSEYVQAFVDLNVKSSFADIITLLKNFQELYDDHLAQPIIQNALVHHVKLLKNTMDDPISVTRQILDRANSRENLVSSLREIRVNEAQRTRITDPGPSETELQLRDCVINLRSFAERVALGVAHGALQRMGAQRESEEELNVGLLKLFSLGDRVLSPLTRGGEVSEPSCCLIWALLARDISEFSFIL